MLTKCCRSAYAGGDGGPLAAGTTIVDWNRFLQLARRHRVQGLAWRSLAPFADAIPAPVTAALRTDAAGIATDNLRFAQESVELTRILAADQIPILFLKGLTLAALSYPSPFLKHGWDIDVLVPSDRIRDSIGILQRRGYEAKLPRTNDWQALARWYRFRKETAWHDPQQRTFVELHSRPTDNARLIPRVGTGSSRQTVTISPGLSLPTLADEELFAYLCVHGATSAWFRLKWIADLAAFLHRRQDRVEHFWVRSQELGAGRAAGQALLLAHRLFGSLTDPSFLAELQRDRVVCWLADAAHDALAGKRSIREPTDRFLGTATIHFSQILLQRGLSFKVAETWRQVRALAPWSRRTRTNKAT